MSTIKCTNCGEVFNSDGVAVCLYRDHPITSPDPLREWVPVSTPPKSDGWYGAAFPSGEIYSMKFKNGEWIGVNLPTHWCAFPPMPAPKGAFEKWWETLPRTVRPELRSVTVDTAVKEGVARIIFAAGQAAGEGSALGGHQRLTP